MDQLFYLNTKVPISGRTDEACFKGKTTREATSFVLLGLGFFKSVYQTCFEFKLKG